MNNPLPKATPRDPFFKPLSAKVMPKRFIAPEGREPLSEEAAIVKQRKEVSAAFNQRYRKKANES